MQLSSLLFLINGALLSCLLQAAVKYHRLGISDNKHLFLTHLKAGKPKIRVLTNLAFGANTSWLAMASLRFRFFSWGHTSILHQEGSTLMTS